MNYQECLDCYNALVQKHPSIDRKGKSMPYTSLNGHMTSFLSKEGGMGLRLSKEDIVSFVVKYNAKLMEQHGRIMKEFVEIPETLLTNTEELSPWFENSLSHTSSLKPKPSKKKK